jgi:hypothetical protein
MSYAFGNDRLPGDKGFAASSVAKRQPMVDELREAVRATSGEPISDVS